jgi:hypothetical protein
LRVIFTVFKLQNSLFLGFSSTLIAPLFGKHPLFPKPVRTSTEQIPNKTPINFKKIVKGVQRGSKAVKSCHALAKAVKKEQFVLLRVKIRQLQLVLSNVLQRVAKMLFYCYYASIKFNTNQSSENVVKTTQILVIQVTTLKLRFPFLSLNR